MQSIVFLPALLGPLMSGDAWWLPFALTSRRQIIDEVFDEINLQTNLNSSKNAISPGESRGSSRLTAQFSVDDMAVFSGSLSGQGNG